jgi:predicted nucleic acid-binding protein
VSIRNVLRPGAVLTHAQVTDAFLLGLAVRNGGKLATFDHRIPSAAVEGGKDALELIPVS